VLPDGTAWDRGDPRRPLCATCPERSKSPDQQCIRCITVVHRYADEEKVPKAVLAAISQAREH